MLSQEWKEKFLKIPGAKQVQQHLLAQGHTEPEAEVGGLLTSGLVLLLAFLLIESFLIGVIRSFFDGLWNFCRENPPEGIAAGFLSGILFVSILFKISQKNVREKARKAEENRNHLRRMGEK